MPRDFVMWMNGAIKVLGDRAPTQEEWEQIKQAHAETVGKMIADKMDPNSSFETYLKIVRDYQNQVYGTRTTIGGAITGTSIGRTTLGTLPTCTQVGTTASTLLGGCTDSDPCCGGNCS